MTDQDFLPLEGIDFIEFYVGNAKQAALFYEACFGFEMRAYAGPETGVKDHASYFVQQGNVRLVLTAALQEDSPIAAYILKYGDGVKVVALEVDDAAKAFEQTTGRGAKPASETVALQDEYGTVKLASIHTYGEVIHTFVERKNYNGPFLPGYMAKASTLSTPSLGFKYVDHCLGTVGVEEMDKWVEFYKEVMNFKPQPTLSDRNFGREYTLLMAKTAAHDNKYTKFSIHAPAKSKKQSAIEGYFNPFNGSGVHHIAIAVEDIILAVSELKNRGIEFLPVADSYYDDLVGRTDAIGESISRLKALNILVDKDEDGYLLHAFTKSIVDRPAFFYEITQRKSN